jgi:hypothetical protein
MSFQRTFTHLLGVALLLLWGAVMLYFYATGRVAQYLPGDGLFRPMLLAGGVAMLVLGLFNLATMGTDTADCGHDHSHDEHEHNHGQDCCGHDLDHTHEHVHDHAHGILDESGPVGRTAAILILSVPLIVAAAMTPDSFSPAGIIAKGLYDQDFSKLAKVETRLNSAKSVANAAPPAAGERVPGSAAAGTTDKVVSTMPAATTSPAGSAPKAEAKSYGSFTLEDLKKQVPQNKAGDFQLEVPEIYYTAGDKEVQGVLKGQPVETTAQVLPEKVNNEAGKRLRIFRLQVQCCAADARPFSIPAEFEDKAPDIADMTWVKIHGVMDYQKEGDQVVPVLKVTSYTETSAPENTMLY